MSWKSSPAFAQWAKTTTDDPCPSIHPPTPPTPTPPSPQAWPLMHLQTILGIWPCTGWTSPGILHGASANSILIFRCISSLSCSSWNFAWTLYKIHPHFSMHFLFKLLVLEFCMDPLQGPLSFFGAFPVHAARTSECSWCRPSATPACRLPLLLSLCFHANLVRMVEGRAGWLPYWRGCHYNASCVYSYSNSSIVVW